MSLTNYKLATAIGVVGSTFVLAFITANFSILLFSLTVSILIFTLYHRSISTISLPLISTLCATMIGEWFVGYFESELKLTYFEEGTGYTQNYGFKKFDGTYQGIAGEFPFKLVSLEGDVIYDVTYTLGNDGFRDDVNETLYDVFIYGGSFTYGEGLEDNETMPHYLHTNHSLAAKNVGFHGWGVHNALYNLQTGIGKVPGSINILLTAPWHSLRSACKQQWTGNHPKYTIDADDLKHVGSCRAGNKSILMSFLLKTASKSKLYSLYRKKTIDLSISDNDIHLWLEIIKEFQAESERNKSKLIVAYIDARENDLINTSWSNQTIIEYLKEISDQVIDVTLADRREELKPIFFIHKLDQHPSATANKARAALLAPAIQKLLD